MGRRFVDVRQQSELKTEKNPQPNLTIYTTSNLKRKRCANKDKEKEEIQISERKSLKFQK